MNNETEKYLQDICFEENPQVLDDDRPDYFDVWIASQEPEDWLRHINTILPLAQETARREVYKQMGEWQELRTATDEPTSASQVMNKLKKLTNNN